MTSKYDHNNDYHNTKGKLLRTKEEWLDEGIKHYIAKHYKSTLIACEQAIQLDSNYARAYHGKGLAFIALKCFEEAILVCQQAIQLDPQNAKAYTDLEGLSTNLEGMKNLV